MKITQDVRDYARKQGIANVEVALEQGMQDKAEEFKTKGAEVYQKA
jgi:phosphomethylpyrimidine synthase